MCEISDKTMRDMDMMHDEIKSLREKLDAVAKYLKMAFKYDPGVPESFEMVKPEELAKEGMVPTVSAR